MGLVAVASGTLYAILNFFWLRKLELPTDKLDDDIENGEADKLNNEVAEPKFKNASTMVSYERLHLMIEYNQIGSLSSLHRNYKSDTNAQHFMRARSASIRRGSYSIGMIKSPRSASKVDMLKSDVANSRNSIRNSGNLNRQGNNSIGKVNIFVN